MLKGVILDSVMENITSCNSPDTTPSSDFMLTSLLNAAEYELHLISQRARLAIEHKKSQGFKFGVTPYGKRASRTVDNVRIFEDDGQELRVVEFIKSVRGSISLDQVNGMLKDISEDFHPLELDDNKDVITDGLSFKNIAEILNDYGIYNRGKLWKATSVSRVLQEK
jgi:hypothetical protein